MLEKPAYVYDSENEEMIMVLPSGEEFIITKNITKATHWIPYNTSEYSKVKLYQPYEIHLIYEKEFDDYDYYAKEDDKTYSMAWFILEGDFVIKSL